MNFPPLLWPRISQLFDDGCALDGGARESWLVELQARDPACAPFVRGLLDASAAPGGADPLSQPLHALRMSALAAALDTPVLKAGAMLGPYRLLALLGEGGMATVWLAEQTAGVLRQVALKIPHLGLEEGRATAQRFARERDFLAALEHPHIARLYDAGISHAAGSEGVPYLAIELVAGVPITAYCEGQRLTLPQRLALFSQVLAAVGHAHAHLVIHRDIKAGNILVTPQGDVKLLDFGIARLLQEGADMPDASAAAAGETRVFTPDTASPEQLAGLPLTTASDVYSLGVVLYELLAGQRPYRLTADGPNAAGLAAQLHMLLIKPPSACHFDAAAATARRTTVPGLRRQLAGDLDAIVLKALRADPAQRYASVGALSADLQRQRAQQPVAAMPDTHTYRASRFVARHRWPLASASAVMLALCVGLALALWQASVAQDQARRGREMQAFMKQLFRTIDPEQAQGRDISARELLQRGAARLEAELGGQPQVLAEMQAEVGEILMLLGAHAQGKPYLDRAVAALEKQGPWDGESVSLARLNLSDLLINEGQWAPARQLAQRSLDAARPRWGPVRPWALHAQSNLALISSLFDPTENASPALQAALDEHRRAGHTPSRDTVHALSTLGHIHFNFDDYAKARDAYTQSIAEADTAPGITTTSKLLNALQLNFARLALDEDDAVLREMPGLAAALERHLGPQAGYTLTARRTWAHSLVALGRYDEGLALQRESAARAEARGVADNQLNINRAALARLCRLAGRYAEGLGPISQAVAYYDSKSAVSWRTESLRRVLGELQRGVGDASAGLQTLTRARAQAHTLPGHATKVEYAAILQALALAQHAAGQAGLARQHMAQAQAIYSARFGPDGLPGLRSTALLAWLGALAQPLDAAAQAGFEQAATAYARRKPVRHAVHADLDLMRADLHDRAGRSGQAQALRSSAAQAWKAATGRAWQPPLVLLH